MKALALLMVLVLLGCAGDNESEASLSSFSESNGVLHVSGSGWNGCRRVIVDLPEPWAHSNKQVGQDGRFALLYAHPLVMPYRGEVRATCATNGQEVSTEIRVGDSRAQK